MTGGQGNIPALRECVAAASNQHRRFFMWFDQIGMETPPPRSDAGPDRSPAPATASAPIVEPDAAPAVATAAATAAISDVVPYVPVNMAAENAVKVSAANKAVTIPAPDNHVNTVAVTAAAAINAAAAADGDGGAAADDDGGAATDGGGGRAAARSFIPSCACPRPAAVKTATTATNKGREFFVCASRACKFRNHRAPLKEGSLRSDTVAAAQLLPVAPAAIAAGRQHAGNDE